MRILFRTHIFTFVLLLKVHACSRQASEVDGNTGESAEETSTLGDGSGGETGSDTENAGTGGVCTGLKPARSLWAAWKMPNPEAAALPNPASYTDLGDGTVRDNVTCLVWQRDVSADTYSQVEADGYCASLSLTGGGWRLPTRIELVSLVDFSSASPGPTIDTAAFPDAPSEVFWSSSQTPGEVAFAWYVSFATGTASAEIPELQARVRCVR